MFLVRFELRKHLITLPEHSEQNPRFLVDLKLLHGVKQGSCRNFYSAAWGRIFLSPKIFSSLNIFWSTRRMTFIFSPIDRAMLGEHVRYLERGCRTCKKFFRGMENQVFLEKRHFLKGLTRKFGDFKTPKNPILSLLCQYFLIYVSYDLHFFSNG